MAANIAVDRKTEPVTTGAGGNKETAPDGPAAVTVTGEELTVVR